MFSGAAPVPLAKVSVREDVECTLIPDAGDQ